MTLSVFSVTQEYRDVRHNFVVVCEDDEIDDVIKEYREVNRVLSEATITTRNEGPFSCGILYHTGVDLV